MRKRQIALIVIVGIILSSTLYLAYQYKKSYSAVDRIVPEIVENTVSEKLIDRYLFENSFGLDIIDDIDSILMSHVLDEDMYKTELQLIEEESNRINILALGVEDYLADVIMVFSVDIDNRDVDIITIPRDTYVETENHDVNWERKINAVYSFPEDGRVPGTIYAVENLLEIPMDYYIQINKNGVANVVDALGGYGVYIPYQMDYDDPYDTPPLEIHFEEGYQWLNGTDTVKYLRFRKNNDGTIAEGDLQRSRKYVDFFETMLSQALSFNLPNVIDVVFEQIRTDIPLTTALTTAGSFVTMTSDDLEFYTIPGEAQIKDSLSYYIADYDRLEHMILSIYKNEESEYIDTVIKK